MKAILAFALTHRPIVVIGAFVFLIGGLFAFSRLDIEAYPNPAPVILEITAQAAGLSAEEIEKYYTIPIEVGLYPTPGVETVRSTSFYGLSFVRVTFKYGIDYDFAYQEAAIMLGQNVNLPGNLVPSIQASSLTGEIYRYEVTGPPGFGLTNLRTVQDYLVERRLLTVPGIVQINTFGGTTKAFDVDVDLKKLEAFGVTVPQLLTAIGNANANVGGREIQYGQQSINIRGVGLIDTGGADDLTKGTKTGDIEKIVLNQVNGVPVQVKDVAKVSVGYLPRLGIVGRDKNDDIVEAIVVMGYKEHTNDVLPRLKAEVAKINADGSLPPGVKVVPFYDRDSLVNVTTHTVLENLITGVSLVFLVQWIFLGNLRAAIIIALNIPFALLSAFIMITLRGDGANLLSVGAVDFGIFVDAAVILIENIFQNFALKRTDRQNLLRQLSAGRWGVDPSEGRTQGQTWTKRLRLFFVSAVQVNSFIFFTQAITVAAFVPLFTMQGVEGQIFGPMARTYVYAMMGALLATFTVTPALASLLLPVRIEEAETIVVRMIRAVYTPMLRFSVDHYRVVIVLGVAILGLAAFAATRLGSEFLPALEEGNFYIRAALPPTMSLDAGTDLVRKMREILMRHPEVITVTSQHGRPDNGSDASPFSNVEMFVPLKPLRDWPAGLTKDKLTNQLQNEFNEALPGVGFNFSQYIQDNVEEALSGVKGANSVKIIGPNIDTLEKLAADVSDQLRSVDGMSDVGTFHVSGQPNLNIKVDRARAARYGLNTGDVDTIVQTAIGGSVATTILEGDREFSLIVRLAPHYRDTIQAISNIKVGYSAGSSGPNAYIPLRELATITLDTGASYIYRERSYRYIPIKFSVRGRDLGGAVEEAQARIAQNIHLPPGYRIIFSGEFEDLKVAQHRLAVVLPFTFFLILVLLYSLFNSLRFTLLTLVGIPFLVACGVFALYLTGLNFSISAAIGFISLLGVAVMDGILNLAYFRELRNEGLAVADAIFKSAEQRMRPMLMTALSNGIGLMPAAISTGIGSQVQKPLATVIVGGMIAGPILLLIIAPAVRMLFLRHEDRDGPTDSIPTRQAPAPNGGI